MDLRSALSIASSGLTAVQYQLSVASQNVANASTPGYVTEIANVASRDTGGVVVKLTTRAVNDTIQNELCSQNATVAALDVTSNALGAVSSVQGSTSASSGATGTLSDDLGYLKNGFTTLEANPSSSTDQNAVLSAASSLANTIQTLSGTYQTQRQAAQNSIVSGVQSVNSALGTIGTLSRSIVQAKAAGDDTADLENQRASAMTTLSGLIGVSFNEASNGDLQVRTSNGTVLSTQGGSGPLSTSNVNLTATTAYGSVTDPVPAITSTQPDGSTSDVTTSLTGGSLGANIALRDTTLPTMQSQLDSFSAALSSRFVAGGVTLFTDASGNVAGPDTATTASNGGQVGFSSSIQVNAAVAQNPAIVSYGDQYGSIVTPTTDVTSAILGTTFGTSSTDPYGSSSLATLATTLTTDQARTIAAAATQLTAQTDIQTTLQKTLTSSSGVSVDDQMSTVVALQNAYEANAKVISTVQTMFNALIASIG